MTQPKSAVLSALPLPAGAPTEFRILRAGVNKTEMGDFVFDEQAALSVMEAYRSKGIDKPQIDYEHQSLLAPPAGGTAAKPAAGWFKPAVRAGELWATEVAWTAAAMGMLAPAVGAPEYRFFSPILRYDEESMRIRSIKNLALTNDPAMDEIGPLAAASRGGETRLPLRGAGPLSADAKAAILDRVHGLGATQGATAQASLSATQASQRDQRTDAEVVAALSATDRKIIESIVGPGVPAVAKQARLAALVANRRVEEEAQAAQLERGRCALGAQR